MRDTVIISCVLSSGTAGMNLARIVEHALIEGKRRGVKFIVASMCVGGGMGAAALF